jgi:hypothetical protein
LVSASKTSAGGEDAFWICPGVPPEGGAACRRGNAWLACGPEEDCAANGATARPVSNHPYTTHSISRLLIDRYFSMALLALQQRRAKHDDDVRISVFGMFF